MTKHMDRLPLSRAQRDRLSAVHKGVRKTPEHRAKISAALAGRSKSPEHRDKIVAARRARTKQTPEEIIAATLKRSQDRWAAMYRALFAQWRRDKRRARAMGDMELLADIQRSRGWWIKRRYRGFPGVSDGFSKRHGNRIVWSKNPYVRLARIPARGKPRS